MELLRLVLRKRVTLILFWMATVVIIGHELLAPPSLAVAEDEKAPEVFCQLVKKRAGFRELIYPVRVEAAVSVTLTAEFDGVIKDILLSAGAPVTRGQTVLLMQNEDPAFHYAPAAVRAPLKGILAQLHATPLAKVARGDKLATLIQPGKLKMIAEVPAAELRLLDENSDGIFSAENFSDSFQPEFFVNSISPLVDPKTNTAPVELQFFAKKNLPPIGTVGSAKFQVATAEKIKIPESALAYFDDSIMVRLVDGSGRVRKQKVEINSEPNGDIVVTEGLKGGERLIVRSPRPLKEGERVDAKLLPGEGE